MVRAHDFKGAAFVEIYQNCPVYNDGIFEHVKDKKTAADTRLMLEHGKPLTFGHDNEKGIRMNPKTLLLEKVTIGEDGVTEDDLVVHDETNKILAKMLAGLKGPEFPEPMGVLYCEPNVPSYTDDVHQQQVLARETRGTPDLNALLRSGHTWTVE